MAAVRLGAAFGAGRAAGALDREAFVVWTREFLVPGLRPGDLVVMDNLSVHKSRRAQDLIEAAGAAVAYLPPYSPDLNPIEKMWSKVKTLLRGAKARSEKELDRAVVKAIAAVTPQDTEGWFRSCGYDI